MKKFGFIGKYCLALSLVVGATATALASFSAAWFTNGEVDDPIIGRTARGYFAGGDGTPEIGTSPATAGPFQIRDPIHLYNLAWLQYIGYFKSSDAAGSPVQKYFVLTKDIDMTGWALPPIGTEERPFYGHFDGQGFKISGLTVSNSWSDIQTRHPDSVTQASFSANIVGFIGVIGPYKNAATPASYSSSANAFKNTSLEGITIKSTASKTLVGLAAGYVNGSLEGVAVNDSHIDLREAGTYLDGGFTQNLSDYSLIGHAADPNYLGKLQSSTTVTDTPVVDNPFLTQGGDQWGGSIDMKTMYENLRVKKYASQYYSSTFPTYEEEARTLNPDGSYTPTTGYQPIPSSTQMGSYNDANQTHNNGRNYFYHNSDTGKKLDGTTDVQTASYNFVSRYKKNGFGWENYVGLGGRYSLHDYNYTKESNTKYDATGYYYRDSGTGNYLSTDGSSLTATTDKNAAAIWFSNGQNHLYANVGKKLQYLNLSGATLTLGNSGTTAWTWDASTSTYMADGYYLIYSNGRWVAQTNTQSTVFDYATIRQGSYYLSVQGGQPQPTNIATNAARLHFEDGSYGYAYVMVNSTKRYLENNTNTTLAATFDQGCFIRRASEPNHLYCVRDREYMEITSDEVWGNRQKSNTIIQEVTHTSTASCTREQASGLVTVNDATFSETRHVYANESYFPLTWKEGGTNTPSLKNTGYVIGGSNYDGGTVGSIGDVRVSGRGAYPTNTALRGSFISGSSYSSANFAPYAFNNSGTAVKIGDPLNGKQFAAGYSDYSSVLGFKKYYRSVLGHTTGSRLALDAMISGGTAYGLHFMNADIAMDNLITVPYVAINGQEWENYQLPRDAIDFTLKTDGYINFFAHTGFVNLYNGSTNWNDTNNSFFSLHWIDRAGESIQSIQQIAKIYKNTECESDHSQPQYVYTFRNASDMEVSTSWSTGVPSESGSGYIVGNKGELVFDTYWLTDPEYNEFKLRSAYYFEIPVNRGEFALGSSSGKTKTSRGWPRAYNKNGAYLMYLDIGASQKTDTAITITERSQTTSSEYSYPKGVDFKMLPAGSDPTFHAGITGGESGAIRLEAEDKMNVGFTYSQPGGTPTLSVGKDDGGGGDFQACYKARGTAVVTTAGAEVPLLPGGNQSVDVLDRVTVYDLTKSENNYTTTTRHTIDGIAQAETSETSTKSWTEEQIGAVANFTFAGVTLFSVSYTASSGSGESPGITLEASYDPLTSSYTLNFVTKGANSERVDLKFTALNLSQSHVDEYGVNHDYAFHVIIANNGVATGAAIGEVTAASLNQLISLTALPKP